MINNFILYKHSRIHYECYGKGSRYLFCFHGYGEQGSSFSFLEPYLGDYYRLIAIDLPFHGETHWLEGNLLKPEELMEIIDLIYTNRKNKITLLGYSMGGRVALQLLEKMPDRIGRVVLVAPDGLRINLWLWFASCTKLGNLLFRVSMVFPQWIFLAVELFCGLGIYRSNMRSFVHFHLDRKGPRMLLYRRWTTLRRFMPRPHRMKNIISSQQIPVGILFGSYDSVIPSRYGKTFRSGVERWVTIREQRAGHKLLKDKYARAIQYLFLN